METQVIRAMGRKFETSPNGFLLDLNGNETPFKTDDLFLKHEGAFGLDHFNDAEPGDYVAHGKPYETTPAYADPETKFDLFVLVRDGRMVRFVDNMAMRVIYD